MDKILQAALSQGLWSALFVFLLFYVLHTTRAREDKYEERERQSQKREEGYQKTIGKNEELISKLSNSLVIVQNIQDDVEAIKDYVFTDKKEE